MFMQNRGKKSDKSLENHNQNTTTAWEATELQKGIQAEHGKNLEL